MISSNWDRETSFLTHCHHIQYLQSTPLHYIHAFNKSDVRDNYNSWQNNDAKSNVFKKNVSYLFQ